MDKNTIEEMNIRGMKAFAEPSTERDFLQVDWGKVEELAKVFSDDDPRCELTGYEQSKLDEYTKSILHAKAKIMARDGVASLASLFCGGTIDGI